jgi:deoxyribodipyrimidine photo-lyase
MSQTSLFSDELYASEGLKAPMVWQPTREAGLARLKAFLPSAGSAYARTRNGDFGPQDRSNVSALSPWLSRRMITEEEVVKAVLERHSFVAAEKFIQEVYWRTYWKGWLEMRPDVLVQFNKQRLDFKVRLIDDAALAKRVTAAMNGTTGIACFDAWVGELRNLGWLHNHARMWFASIWIFTLRLPWQLGADFFYKHLLDADAASNTLSWRWVAGLHTKGKHYLARASNIRDHSGGRFDPSGQLNENADALTQDYITPGPNALLPARAPKTDRVGLLITEDDLHPVSLDIGAHPIGAATFSLPLVAAPESPRAAFSQDAISDAKTRTETDFGIDVATLDTVQGVVDWATSLGVGEVVTAYAPCGLIAWELKNVARGLKDVGIDLVQVRRDWDSRTWPLATGGFFKLKEKLPSLIRAL